MAYADVDESLIEAEEDGSQPDRDQDLKPRFHGSDEAEDDDDDVVNTWNLRKCSAAALDILSNVFGDEILPTLMPIVEVIGMHFMNPPPLKKLTEIIRGADTSDETFATTKALSERFFKIRG